MPFVLAFEFGTTFCAEKAGTAKLCKEKCLSQSLVAPKTKAPTKFHGTTPRTMPKTTFGILPTTEQTFDFVPFARNVDHFGTNCTNIFFPTEVDKFLLNITATPYEIACNEYEKRAKIDEPIPSDYYSGGRLVNACMAVPSEKCQKHVELYACYESIGNKPSVNAIGELCQKHLNNATNAAGFAVQICAHRHQTEGINELIVNRSSTFHSLMTRLFQKTRTLPISMDKIRDTKKKRPYFLIEFGQNEQKSAIREKGDGENNDGISSILKDIAPQMINGTLAKMIHFVPPSDDDKMRAFFQLERPKFSQFIINDTDLLPYQSDPNNTRRATPCDDYGADCVPIRNLLLKIEALANCGKNESENNAIFKMPPWAPPLSPPMTIKKPSETLICDGDMACDKRRLQEQYNRLRKICGLKPEEVENQRKKRQYNPYEKWTESPIKIAINKSAPCGWFKLGRQGGWQYLRLGMTNGWCIDFNMSVVACHELLHALGFEHEQSRNDARNYIILREYDGQSKIDPNTQNFGFPYDFGSVMHYPSGGDHEEGLYNLITLPRFYQQTIGQTERISFKDAAIINRIYCNDSCKGHEDKCQNGGYLNPNDCTKCHCPDGYGGEYCKALEENLNCEDLSGIPRELVTNQSAVSMKTKVKCVRNWPCRCNWRIKPEAGKKARIQFKSLSNLFECTYNCSSAYVEIKYRADKRAQGAKLCCPRALTDLNGNEYKNWIAAEKPDMDIVISAHLSPKWTVPSTVFELTYESGNVRMFFSSKCVKIENLYAEKRNPGTGTLYCYDGLNNRHYACSCNGDKKCLAEEKYEHDSFICPIIKVNGIQIHGSRQTMHTDPKHYHYNSTQIDVNCFKAQGGTVSFWVYRNPETEEMIRVDEVHCLTDKAAAGVPKQFKSLPVEEQPPMSPTSPFLANNNASSLIHVFVPFGGYP
ncbi:hypothetical protein niasHT_025503 [Heterodera trifolii]|uniref:Metalloendopeptidase n=1 Tax=Heterodera trifolii TaxID=157864 RepID=A0ABD2J8U7_9BILA